MKWRMRKKRWRRDVACALTLSSRTEMKSETGTKRSKTTDGQGRESTTKEGTFIKLSLISCGWLNLSFLFLLVMSVSMHYCYVVMFSTFNITFLLQRKRPSLSGHVIWKWFSQSSSDQICHTTSRFSPRTPIKNGHVAQYRGRWSKVADKSLCICTPYCHA